MINDEEVFRIIQAIKQLEIQKNDILILEQLQKKLKPIQKHLTESNELQQNTILKNIDIFHINDLVRLLNKYPKKISESQKVITKLIEGLLNENNRS